MKNSGSKGARRAALALIATIAAGAGVVASGAPAIAATSNCPSKYLCIWKDTSYKTDGKDSALVKFQYYIPNYGQYKYEGTSLSAANSATSIYNHGATETAYMYANTNKGGFLFSIPKGNTNSWLVGGGGDNIESGYYASYN